jgi:hypothetical protein
MDIGLYSYKRSRGIIKHKTAVPIYPAPAAPTTPAQAGGSHAKPAAAAPWPSPAPPPSAVTVVDEVIIGNSGAPTGADDVDRRATLFISRVQERLRRERVNEDYWRKYY